MFQHSGYPQQNQTLDYVWKITRYYPGFGKAVLRHFTLASQPGGVDRLGRGQDPNQGEGVNLERRRDTWEPEGKQSDLLAAVDHLLFLKGVLSSTVSPSLKTKLPRMSGEKDQVP